MPLIGRKQYSIGSRVVVLHNNAEYSVSSLLGIPEDRLEREFFQILSEDPKELYEPDRDSLIRANAERFLLPVPRISSIRDFFAFEEHVRNARAIRGEKVPDEWYRVPVFYFSNPHSGIAHLEDVHYPRYSKALDYEMELAFIIGREGRDISAADYERYVLGVTMANDWSARDAQNLETRMGLGPAKGKDFATSFGPMLLAGRDLSSLKRSRGKYDIYLGASVNGANYGKGNMLSIHYDLGAMIERASEEVTLYPGDVIMTGTFGNGCILEFSQKGRDWLKRGDLVTLHSGRIGDLTNRVI